MKSFGPAPWLSPASSPPLRERKGQLPPGNESRDLVHTQSSLDMLGKLSLGPTWGEYTVSLRGQREGAHLVRSQGEGTWAGSSRRGLLSRELLSASPTGSPQSHPQAASGSPCKSSPAPLSIHTPFPGETESTALCSCRLPLQAEQPEAWARPAHRGGRATCLTLCPLAVAAEDRVGARGEGSTSSYSGVKLVSPQELSRVRKAS